MSAAVRIARSKDRDTLVALMAEFYAETATPFDAGQAATAFEVIFEEEDLGCVFILEEEGSAVGYAVLTVGFSMEFGGRDGFLDDLFIQARHRGLGLGRLAMTAVLEESRKRDVRALHLEVAQDNVAAKELYRRFGFVDTDRKLMTVRIGGVGRGVER